VADVASVAVVKFDGELSDEASSSPPHPATSTTTVITGDQIRNDQMRSGHSLVR
jgi:hypothetical protein